MPADYYIVSISDQAFFSLITSALEAYKVSHIDDDQSTNHIPIETYGNLWGYQAKTKRNENVFRIVFADVDTSATRTPNSVRPQQKSFTIKEEFVDCFYPELEYLGDFHSHPYDFENDSVSNAKQLEQDKLYCFSDGDFASVNHLKKEEKRKYRIGIVTTVFSPKIAPKRQSSHINDENKEKDLSCIRFSHDGLVIWIKCYIFGRGKTLIQNEDIALMCPILGLHAGSIESCP